MTPGLKKAMQSRKLPELEKAINFVKHHGFEPQLHNEMRAAHLVLLQLRQLERIRAEILELKQSTVAEIRSYSKPPPIVHTIMTATFLLLGHKERETRVSCTYQPRESLKLYSMNVCAYNYGYFVTTVCNYCKYIYAE